MVAFYGGRIKCFLRRFEGKRKEKENGREKENIKKKKEKKRIAAQVMSVGDMK